MANPTSTQPCQIGSDFQRAAGRSRVAAEPGATWGSNAIAMASDPDVIVVLVVPNGIGEGKGSELDWIYRAEEQSGRAEGITSQRKRKEDSNEECSRQVNGLRCGSLSQAGFQENSN